MRITFNQFIGEIIQIEKTQKLFCAIMSYIHIHGEKPGDKFQILPTSEFVIKKSASRNITYIFYFDGITPKINTVYEDRT